MGALRLDTRPIFLKECRAKHIRGPFLQLRQRLLRRVAAVASLLILLAPAIWNRFPLLQYDTGGYLARWYEGDLVLSRSPVFGLFLNVLTWPDFWPAVVVEAALTVWVLTLLLRCLKFGERPLLLVGITAALALLTTLPWLTSVLLTDIFAGLAVLAAHLLIFADSELRRWERSGLVLLVAFSAATHNATLAIVLALLGTAALARWLFGVGSAAGILRGFIAIALGAVLVVGSNYLVARQLTWTPGGLALSFGRMLQDGIVDRYLGDHCPDRHLRLCTYRSVLPPTADEFFWSGEGSLFDYLGGFDGLGAEMDEIVVGSLRDYPLLQMQTAFVAGVRQLFRIATGAGVVNTIWHTYWAIDTFAPSAHHGMWAARQQHDGINFAAINRIDVPVGYASMLVLLVTLVLGWRNAAFADLGLLAASTTTVLLANALVCGVLSNPHDRYGARLIWLGPLIAALLAWRAAMKWRAERRIMQDAATMGLTVEVVPPV
jgi:hypothetical protein